MLTILGRTVSGLTRNTWRRKIALPPPCRLPYRFLTHITQLPLRQIHNIQTSVSIEQELVNVNKQMEKVEFSIMEVERVLERELSEKDTDYWRQKEVSLRQEKASYLRQKELLMQRAPPVGVAPVEKATVVRVPHDIPFSKSLASCVNLKLIEASCKHPVGVDESVADALVSIMHHLPKGEDASYRKPPLIISRLARGGKTTQLAAIFDALRLQNVSPLIISFNGHSKFVLGKGESHSNAILRQIAMQLIELGPNVDPTTIVCTEDDIDNYIGERPFILLIDELNCLPLPGQSLDEGAARMLRNLFLDKKNRHLIFTTHVPMDVDSNVTDALGRASASPTSPRGFLDLKLPISFDLQLLRKMDETCSTLNPAEVAYYGGIPSLIYTVNQHMMTPNERFNRAGINIPLKRQLSVFRTFCQSLIDGKWSSRRPLNQFLQFGSLVEKRISWPLCYIEPIMSCFPSIVTARQINKSVLELEHAMRTTGKGMEWEVAVKVVLLIRGALVEYYGMEIPGIINDQDLVKKPNFGYYNIPFEINSIEDAIAYIDTRVRKYHLNSERGWLLLFSPNNGNFPLFDYIMVHVTPTGEVKRIALQVKAGKELPEKDLPESIESGIVIRGKPTKSRGRNNKKWKYMDVDMLNTFMGHSCKVLVPNVWATL